jgi:hypothetical protein
MEKAFTLVKREKILKVITVKKQAEQDDSQPYERHNPSAFDFRQLKTFMTIV